MRSTNQTMLASVGGMSLILASGQAPAIMTPAYANTLAPLVGSIYDAFYIISRELTGFLPSAMRSPGVERAALNQSVSYPIAPTQTAYDIVPAMTIPEPPDNAFTTGTMAITKSRAVPFGITGEEQRSLAVPGSPGIVSVQAMWIAEALRTLINEMEVDLAVEAAANASRAYGTAGTTPFNTSSELTDAAQIKKILDDNGAPLTGRSMVMNTSAAANLMTVKNISRANENGSQLTLRTGELLDLFGMSLKQSAQAVNKTKGTGTGATTNAAGYAVGAQVITLASAGTGTITAGDVVTFAGDTNKYVVIPNGGDADVSNGGTFTIAAPGLRVAIPASATAITVGGSYAANVAFSADALHIAMRAPAIPQEGDAAADRMMLMDPFTGISFEFAIYVGYKKVRYEIGMAWGVKAVKRQHIALLLG
jgi:hypothetical protein